MMDKLFSEPEKLKLGMMVVADADNLKKINDLYGHHIGDEYLREIAKRLREASGINSVCTRTGGDEFSIFLYGYSSQQQLEAVLQSLKSKRGKPFAPESAKLKETLEFSLGTALFPADGEDYHALMRLADDKMYLEKQERTRSGHRQEYNGRSMTRSE